MVTQVVWLEHRPAVGAIRDATQTGRRKVRRLEDLVLDGPLLRADGRDHRADRVRLLKPRVVADTAAGARFPSPFAVTRA